MQDAVAVDGRQATRQVQADAQDAAPGQGRLRWSSGGPATSSETRYGSPLKMPTR